MKNSISFQGELGSYSHQACLDLYPNHDVVPCSSFELAIDSVNRGESQLAMLPVENSTYGRVADIHSLLPESGLIIIKEYFLRVRISLLALPGSRLDQIKNAISHTVLLGQCRGFLQKNCIMGIAGPDTAGSAKKVASSNDNTIAALASELSGQIYGLKSLASDIEDMSNNTTRFLIMAKNLTFVEKKINKKKCMTTLIFEVRNLPAALYKALGGFATNGINMLKLESYMVGGSFAATQFYLDIEGHPENEAVKRAIEELKYFTSVVKILGVYEKHLHRPKK